MQFEFTLFAMALEAFMSSKIWEEFIVTCVANIQLSQTHYNSNRDAN